ncbi:lipopolysaccharide biosynthesis protein [Anaeromyxobacter sp. PSR-1]|uniref:lipopolysaccharide biosynthesis protein n=1 Tax=Anaeromyxobacter sp. PSR-1 TaxID=1300915 RepID=UPI0005E38E04|nr:oligosaccharide flippase family protein [Anaeromyxobacter sp. PSR-1]GAO01355.1 polysaccharide biosynthesis protein [Anaeromyxobacter sp. PSR-1]
MGGGAHGRLHRAASAHKVMAILPRLRNGIRTATSVGVLALSSDTGALILANLGATILGLVTGIVTARTLGPDGRGDLAVVLFWPALLTSLLDAGISEALTLRSASSHANARSLIGPGLALSSAFSALALAIGYLALPLLLTQEQQRILPLANVGLLFIPLSLLANVPLGLLLGRQRFRAVALIRILNVLLYLLLLAVLIGTRHASVTPIAVSTIAIRAFPLIVGIPLVLMGGRGPLRSTLLAPGLASDAVRLQLPRVASVLASSQDRALANWTLTQAGIGLWQVVSTLTVIMPLGAQAISQRLLSRLAAKVEDPEALTRAAYSQGQLVTLGMAALALPMLPVAIPLLFGASFSPAVAPAAITIIGSLAAASTVVLQSAARSQQRIGPCICSEFVGMGAMAGVAYALVPRSGLAGLAAAFSLGRVSAFAVMAYDRRTHTGESITSLLPSSRAYWASLRHHLRTALTHPRDQRRTSTGPSTHS